MGMNRRMRRGTCSLAVVLLPLLGLSSCGNGPSVAGGGTGGTGISVAATGTLTRGSFSVNGLRDPRSSLPGAVIRVDDDPNGTEEMLRTGMQVHVKAYKIQDDPQTPEVEVQIEAIETEPEVRGMMNDDDLTDDRFTVLGQTQTVLFDDLTVIEMRSAGPDNTMGTADDIFVQKTRDDLADGIEVGVHGGRDDLGRIRATRIELRDDDPEDRLMGTVENLDPGVSFVLNGLTVRYSPSSTVISPMGAEIKNGTFVEVHGTLSQSGGFDATGIDVEDLEDTEFDPEDGEEYRVEGYVSGYAGPPDTLFSVGTTSVRIDGDTRISGGVLANGVRVEAEGHYNQATQTLDAEEIRI